MVNATLKHRTKKCKTRKKNKQYNSNVRAPWNIYCDLDGVLADFDKGISNIFNGKKPEQLNREEMWKGVTSQEKNGGFFASLNWAPGGKTLWKELMKLKKSGLVNVKVLTGIPRYNMKGRYKTNKRWAKNQKKQWCRKNLGYDIEVITCFTSDKHKWSNKKSILIDDFDWAKGPWENKGGIFILHKKKWE